MELEILERLIVIKLVKRLLILWRSKTYHHFLKSSSLDRIMSWFNLVHVFALHAPQVRFSFILPCVLRIPKWTLPLRFSKQVSLCLCFACCMFCPSHPSNSVNVTILGEERKL